MKFLDLFSKIAILVILVVVSIGVNKLIIIDKKVTNFYEHDNSKINLKRVKKIIAQVDYIITIKENNNADVFKKYSKILNPKEIKRIKERLLLAKKSEFYNVELIAYMMFDAEKIVLFDSEHYLKHPTKYSVDEDFLSQLNNYGLDDYQYENLLKLKDVVYEDVNKFFDDVISYAKLKRSNWSKEKIPELGLGANANIFMRSVDKKALEHELKENDVEHILESLQNAYNKYEEIE